MKCLTTLFFIGLFCLSVSAQTKMTDLEFDGYRGNVRTVSIETMPISGSGYVQLKNKRVVWEKWSYDTYGRKSEEYNPQARSRVTYRTIDGVKTSSLKVEKGEPSPPLNLKFAYEYDSHGRVKAERIYLSDDKSPSLKTFEYDENGRISKNIDNELDSTTSAVYKYDNTGNLIEKIEEQKGKGEFGSDSKRRTVYSAYKVDVHGNWTERKSTMYSDGTDDPYVSMDFQVFAYYK
ncbi:MAG: hypothetical protein WBO10_00335 [Pyrinomonadaceae bacterium]